MISGSFHTEYSMWIITLAALGVLGVLFELHVFPGYGVSGAVGAIALLEAAVLFVDPAAFLVVLQVSLVAAALLIGLLWLTVRFFPKNAFLRRFTLTDTQSADYVAGADYTPFIGHTGHAVSTLRPSGVMLVDGVRLTVLTEGDFIEAGTPIRITRVEGARVFVERSET
jgi:membrane-bound serine protease (ClpP class)